MDSIIGQDFKVNLKCDEKLDLCEGIAFVKSPKCGAIQCFIGTIRDSDVSSSESSGDQVQLEPIKAIRYEAYEMMALKQMAEIVQRTLDVEPPNGCSLDHNARAMVSARLGLVPVGEEAIMICVSSTSRKFSYEATMSILNEIKRTVTIWKKIVFSDGREEWDALHKSEAAWKFINDDDGEICDSLLP